LIFSDEIMIDFIEKYKLYIVGFLVLVILVGVVILLWQKKNSPKSSITKNSSEIRVDIEGAIKKPGVYVLKSEAILEDLVAQAGGVTENIDKIRFAQEFNRAEVLSDGQKIYLPFAGEVAGAATNNTSGSATESNTIQTAGKINLNSATAEQLDTLSGIGPAYAARIIEYRQAHGGFKIIEEIMEIKGIGQKTFDKIKDQITI